MAILVIVSTPNTLLRKVRAEIDSGKVKTWQYDQDGDFTHSPDQWRNKAWLRPVIESDRIVFRILAPKSSTMSKTVYAVYHGRFIEMLLTHFDDQFSRAIATALPSNGDIVKG